MHYLQNIRPSEKFLILIYLLLIASFVIFC